MSIFYNVSSRIALNRTTYRESRKIMAHLGAREDLNLRDAVQIYREESGAPSNSYDWYRRFAKDRGEVTIGKTPVRAYKQGRVWYVDGKAFTEAIGRHRQRIAHRKQVTLDYSNGIIHGNSGETIYTDWGGYEIHENFRFVWSDIERGRMRSYGSWHCNECNLAAATEHKKKECHLCGDWGGCGRDCTLSRVYCAKCGKAIDR